MFNNTSDGNVTSKSAVLMEFGVLEPVHLQYLPPQISMQLLTNLYAFNDHLIWIKIKSTRSSILNLHIII